MILGFALAAYAIVANDSIQTLGTYLASNSRRPWWVLWIWISGIMVVTVTWGWLANGGDPAFGRLEAKKIDFPEVFTWLFVLPPLCLVILTRMGIPVSTSLLVLTGFKGLVAQQQGKDAKGAVELFFCSISYGHTVFVSIHVPASVPVHTSSYVSWHVGFALFFFCRCVLGHVVCSLG